MSEAKSTRPSDRRPHGLRDHASADERQRKHHYTAGASGEQDISIDGQLGPDEISEPDEVIKNNEAKHHQ